MKNAEGIWQFDVETKVDDDKGKLMNEHYIFSYDGDTVTLRFISMHPTHDIPKDDFYKLKAKFVNNILYYLPPVGDWIELAVFENGRFVIVGNGRKRVFKNISDKEVLDWNKDILKEGRLLPDYYIMPGGSIR